MFYKNFINHREKLLHFLRISVSEKCLFKLQIEDISKMLINLKKSHFMFKVVKSIYIFESLFMNTFALISNFKQLESCLHSCYIV